MTIEDRIKEVRDDNKLTQTKFGKKLGVTRDVIKNIELGNLKNGVPDSIIKLISFTFNVSEQWLRTGEGDKSNKKNLFSLDELLKKQQATKLEIEIVKLFFSLDMETRGELISKLKKVFQSESSNNEFSAAKEETDLDMPPEYINMSEDEMRKDIENRQKAYEKKRASCFSTEEKDGENDWNKNLA